VGAEVVKAVTNGQHRLADAGLLRDAGEYDLGDGKIAQRSMWGSSCKTTFSNELWISM
jgi:hypothetical protein